MQWADVPSLHRVTFRSKAAIRVRHFVGGFFLYRGNLFLTNPEEKGVPAKTTHRGIVTQRWLLVAAVVSLQCSRLAGSRSVRGKVRVLYLVLV